MESIGRFQPLGEMRQGSRLPPAEIGGVISVVEAEAFASQWSSVQLSVRAYLNSYLNDRSGIDDCIQEVALLAWRKGPRGSMNEPFLAFCLACAKRIAMSEIRKKYRNRNLTLSVESAASLAEVVATMEMQDPSEPAARISALQVCLDSLGPAPRRLLELRYASKDNTALQKEARSTGKSMDAIYKKLERLRTLLRECVVKKSAASE